MFSIGILLCIVLTDMSRHSTDHLHSLVALARLHPLLLNQESLLVNGVPLKCSILLELVSEEIKDGAKIRKKRPNEINELRKRSRVLSCIQAAEY